MDFAPGWVDCVMNCISTVTYSIVVNGIVGDSFVPTRGLRQGDPLSPYLFLLCSEGLSALLRLSAQNGSLKGVRITRSAPLITHLFFAYDSLIFSEASFHGANTIKTILNTYAASSGQLVNFDKSNVFFSSNVSAAVRNVICTTLGVSSISCPETYLGLLFALNLDLSKVFVETDAKTVYLKLASCELDRSEIGSHTRDIKILALHFVSCSFSFISRNGNRVAHAMAVAGFQDGTDRFWVEDVPASVLRVVSEDWRFIDPP
ncbi:hypothetical protein GQ457_09G024500 [Hibiscus cannabinus]